MTLSLPWKEDILCFTIMVHDVEHLVVNSCDLARLERIVNGPKNFDGIDNRWSTIGQSLSKISIHGFIWVSICVIWFRCICGIQYVDLVVELIYVLLKTGGKTVRNYCRSRIFVGCLCLLSHGTGYGRPYCCFVKINHSTWRRPFYTLLFSSSYENVNELCGRQFKVCCGI